MSSTAIINSPTTQDRMAVGRNVFNHATSQNDRATASTASAMEIAGRIKTKTINILDDVNIVRNVIDGRTIRDIYLCDELVEQTGNRFTTSIAGVIGTSLSNLSWIGYKDMVQRIHGKEGKEVSLTYIEGVNGGEDEVMAVIPTKRADAALPGISEMISHLNPEVVTYAHGRFFLNRTPDSISEFSILGDSYLPSSWLALPADNYGDVRRFLGTVRVLCSNGLILMNSDFEEIIKNSQDKFSSVMASLSHISDSMLENLRKRLTVADSTLISGKEVNGLLIAMMQDRRSYTRSRQYDEVTRERGNTHWFDRIIRLEDIMIKDGVGGMAGILKGDLDILGAIDCKVSVIDAINIFTEISTHYISDANGPVGFPLNAELNESVGKLLSKKRFNLEGSSIVSQRKDLWLAN